MSGPCPICGYGRRGYCRGKRGAAFCNYRARLALGLPRHEALRLLEVDKRVAGILVPKLMIDEKEHFPS